MSLCGAEVIGWKPEAVDKAFHEIVAHALNGTDISGWQPTNPPLTGDAFSIIKASEGVGAPNTNWAGQVDWCRSAGAMVGHYHFCNGLNTPQAEAQYFWGIVSQKWQTGEPIALDVEGDFFAHAADPVGWVLACAQELFALSGLKPLIYLDWSHEKNAAYNWQPLVDYNCGLWGAAYNGVGFGDPSPWPFCVIWQNADTNVSGGDSDVLYGDANTFRAYGTPVGGGFFMALTDQQQTDLYNWLAYVVSPAFKAHIFVGTTDIEKQARSQFLDDLVNHPFPWYGFNGVVPTSGRTTTCIATAEGFADSIAAGVVSTVDGARDDVKAHVDSALAALPAPNLTLTDAQVQTAAAAIAADLKANLPAPLLAALGTQLLTANPAK